MNLKEKIEKVSELRNKQMKLKEAFYEADREKNTNEKKRIDKQIKQLDKETDKINADYKKERETRTIDSQIIEDAATFLTKGQEIQKNIEEYTNILNNKNISDEERVDIQSNIDKLNEENSKLKSDIYNKAMEKTGLSWKDGSIYPTEEIKKEKERLANLEKEKKDLETEREKQREIIEIKKNRMNEQFDIAVQKYQDMLAAGKISQELYELRMQNMMYAKEKDTSMLDKSLSDIDESINKKSKEIEESKSKISDLEEKEKKFDEYNNAYYELFRETLDSYYISNREVLENNKENDEKEKVDSEVKNENVSENENVNVNENDSSKDKNENEFNYINNPSSKTNSEIDMIIDEEEEEPDVVVTSKASFNELYSKLTKGTINDKELDALTDVLADKDNYDKYGITTGMIFNKARKILKYKGGKTFNDIEKFLKNSNAFSKEISFDPSIEKKDKVYSHDILNSWKDVQDEIAFSDVSFSVETYINKIEKYKEDGNELDEKQQRIYQEAMNIKSNLSNYRKALDTNAEVVMEREAKTQNSIFYRIFSSKLASNKALPSSNDTREDNGFVIIDKPFALELDSMVNKEVSEEVELNNKDSKKKTRESDEKTK